MSCNSSESDPQPIDHVITTAVLDQRPSRAPDHAAENKALLELGQAFADSPKAVLQKLAETAMALCGAGSSGISIAENDGDQPIFRWHATAGEYRKYYHGTMPRDFSPCGVVLQRDAMQLMEYPVRAFPYIDAISPEPQEVLLVPFYREDKAIGTVWIVSHTADKRFDAEDARIVRNLAQFAAAAVQSLQTLQHSEEVAIQVTSQQKALELVEQDLREAQRRLQSTLSAAEVATWTWEISTNQVIADKNLVRMFDIPPEIANGAPIEAYIDSIHPEDRDEVQQKVQRTIETGCDYEAIYRVNDPSGSLRWVIARGSVERNEHGIAVRLPGVVVDVTRQKEAENLASRLTHESDQLRRTYETALSNTADLNFVCDSQGKFTYVNKAFLDLWQKDLSEVIGQAAIPSQGPNDITERFQVQVQTVIQTCKSIRDEAAYQTPDGVRQYESIIQPVMGADGALEAVVGSSRDITQRKEFEQHLLETHRQKDEFLATLAHELRNPLAPIRTGLQLLKFDHVSEEDSADAIEVMERQISHLVHLVDDLLDVSRVTSGKIILRRETLDMRLMIQSAIEMCHSNLLEHGHQWTVAQPDEPVLVEGDAVRLTQILTNVINNACKYTPDSGTIAISVQSEAGQALVQVNDNGIGIPEALLTKIFDIFKQVEPALDRAQGGLGLGLTLSQRLVEMHGGSIRAESPGHGQGSTITISLPAITSTEHLMNNTAMQEDLSFRRSLSILAVDDNIGAARLLGKLLGKLGDHQIDVAHDGPTVLEKTAQRCPDLIIMDIGMPGMSGYEVARKLREMPEAEQAFLVALTGYGQDSDREEARQAGFDQHLTKPPSLEALQEILRHPKLNQ